MEMFSVAPVIRFGSLLFQLHLHDFHILFLKKIIAIEDRIAAQEIDFFDTSLGDQASTVWARKVSHIEFRSLSLYS